MFSEPLKKILALIKRTGDRVIIFNPDAPETSYVLMDLDRYAEMAPGSDLVKPHPALPVTPPKEAVSKPILEEKENLTEEDLTDKINREILMWKNQDDVSYLGEEVKTKKPWQIPAQVKEKAQGVE